MHRMILAAAALIIFVSGCSGDNGTGPAGAGELKLQAEYKLKAAEPSGLFYSSATGSLFMVSDTLKSIYELSTEGAVIRTIPVSSFDLEGIVLTKNADTIAVVEEGNYVVAKYLKSGTRVGTFKHVTSTDPKHGLEGITIDESGNYYLINESSPCLIVKLDQAGRELWRKEISYSSDISDICFDSKTGALWLLSDESKLLMKLSMDGSLISRWALPVNQAEGLAMSADKIYICSDGEAKLYVFPRP